MLTKIFSIIFGGIGACMLAAALIFAISTASFISQASTANGTVVGLVSTSGRGGLQPVIQFTTAGGQSVQYTEGTGSNPPAFQVGQVVRVYYNNSDPASSARVDSFVYLWFFPLLFGALGVIFGGIGAGFFTAGFIKRRRQRWLQSHGQPLTVEVSDIGLNRAVSVNGKSPYVITAQWRDPMKNITYTFKSASSWHNPAPLTAGDTVTVLVDPRDFRRYYFAAPTLATNTMESKI